MCVSMCKFVRGCKLLLSVCLLLLSPIHKRKSVKLPTHTHTHSHVIVSLKLEQSGYCKEHNSVHEREREREYVSSIDKCEGRFLVFFSVLLLVTTTNRRGGSATTTACAYVTSRTQTRIALESHIL